MNIRVEIRTLIFLGKRASVVFTIPMSTGLGSAELMVGLDDPKDLFQPKQSCDSMGFISGRNLCWEEMPSGFAFASG